MSARRLEWIYDQATRALDLRFRTPAGLAVHAWIAPRPAYCDRGHWEFNCDAPGLHLDAFDCFPRFYMRLETALEEAELWLAWRIFQDTQTPGFAAHAPSQDGRQATLLGRGGWPG